MKRSKWLIGIGAIACVGCCAIPLFGLLVGASGLGAMAFLSHKLNSELLVCLVPLVMVVLYLFYSQYKSRKQCCAELSNQCSSTQCDSQKVR